MDVVNDVVRAAGGVVWRVDDEGEIEVLLVHRPRYDDWTFPKGKAGFEESDEECAIREVEEETGLRGVLGHELFTTGYIDRKGRPKSVRYWEMTVADGKFQPSDEVDEVRWLKLAGAAKLLSYDRDHDVLDSFVEFAGAAH